MKRVRVGNGCGFWGDNLDAPVRLAAGGRLDYLTLEYLAELTMSILALLRHRDPSAMPRCNPRCANTAGTGPDDEQVVVEITHRPALSIKLRVEGSNFARSSGSSIARAICLPSSTPNWSNGLIPSSTALANVRCS